jgi:hypothetical protein
MRRVWLTTGGAAVLALLLAFGLPEPNAVAGEPPPQGATPETRVDETPLVVEVAGTTPITTAQSAAVEPKDPEDKTCSSGCGSGAKKYVPPLHKDEFERLIAEFAQEPLDPPGEALESLLFHHRDARSYLAQDWLLWLDPERRAFLRRELSRTHAWIAFRVLDDEGAVRMQVDPTRVPLTEKQHLLPNTVADVQPAEFNGTVVRVGRDHLWVRY